jgi:hypothetical protein
MSLKELKAAAEAATPGQWVCEATGLKVSPFGDTRKWNLFFGQHVYEFHHNDGNEAKFIALANPATILKLIAVVEAAKELREYLLEQQSIDVPAVFWVPLRHALKELNDD